MRKLLLLALAACLAFAGCSSDDDKDDNTIRYDEAKGYLTNLASAKHGIVGRWSAGTAHYSYNADGTGCSGTHGQEVLTNCNMTYEILKRENKFIFKRRNSSWSEGKYVEDEIIMLTEIGFKYIDDEGVSRYFSRVSSVQTP